MTQKMSVPVRQHRCGISIRERGKDAQIYVEKEPVDEYMEKADEVVAIIMALTLNFCVKYEYNSELNLHNPKLENPVLQVRV